MNKITFLLALITLLVFGCKNKHSDPLNGLVFGSSESIWKAQLNSLVEKKKLTCIRDGRIYYGSIFDTVYVEIETNTEFGSGKLLDYKLDFALRPDLEFASNRSYFPLSLSYKLISNVFQKMVQLYGKPDSIIPNYSTKLYKTFTEKPIIDSLIGGFKVLWKEKEYNLFFNVGSLGFRFDTTGKKLIGYNLSSSYIYYQHSNYENEINSIIDTAIAGYRIADYVKSEVDSPEIRQIGFNYSIQNRELKLPLIEITHIDNLDNRGITSVLTDIVFFDNYENELARFEDVDFDFGDLKLVSNKRRKVNIPGETEESRKEKLRTEHSTIMIFDKVFNYFSDSPSIRKLESAFQSGSTIKARLEMKAIKLDDSSVLKLLASE